MKSDLAQVLQRDHYFAIVDEVDSILIDEARTPLIISGPSQDRSELYIAIDKLIPKLEHGALRPRREAALHHPHRGRQRVRRAPPARDGAPRPGRDALRPREHQHRPPRQPGAARPRPLPHGQGLHRPQRRGDADRRVHRPDDDRPPALRGPAPGDRGQGGRRHPPRERDPRVGHLPELLPPLREARRHDRHRRRPRPTSSSRSTSSAWSRCRPTCR